MMIEMASGVLYKAFGFNIASEFPLPELLVNEHRNLVDIEIRRDDLTALWHEVSQRQGAGKFVVENKMVMFMVPDTGIFCIQKGSVITVSPMKGSDEDKIRLYILGTCMGVLLMQRKVLPLHGSAMVINGKAYAFVGHSGAGKSTLATVLIHRGYQLLSDDVIAISHHGEHTLCVMPSYPQQKLWQESIHRLGMDHGKFQRLFERENKFAVPVRSQYCEEPLPLAGVIEIEKTNTDYIHIEPIQGLERLNTLYRHTYRNFLIPRLELLEWHFQASVDISKDLDMYIIGRPASGSFTADQLATLVISKLAKEA